MGRVSRCLVVVLGGAEDQQKGSNVECRSPRWRPGEAAPKQIFVGGSDERLRGVRDAARE